MTSWLRRYCNLILHRLLLAVLACVVIETSHSDENICSLPGVLSCNECLSRGPQCAWCFQEGFLDGASRAQRCNTLPNLQKKGCAVEFVEQATVTLKVNPTPPGRQVAPQDVTVQLPPGTEVSVTVEVKQLELYPVDMYYLVDVSASMQDNLNRLKTVGTGLSHRMRDYSSDFRVGFGSFVDKPVSPYINVHPSKVSNPCFDFKMQCRPTHGFMHMLSMTDNTTEFTRIMLQQGISGNMDTPEGGFDAMLQAAVCQRDIGWRPEAKRLLLVMTDQPSHLALDSKLAGIVVPHDGNCHLDSGGYTRSTSMEYPTIGQLAEKLLENSIHSIFAVEHGQYKWYEDLAPFLPGAYVGKLQAKASNLKDLVVEAYKKLLSDVEVEVGVQDQHAHRFWVNVTAVCPTGSAPSGLNKCSGVQPNQTVFFNITIGMKDCPSAPEDVLIFIRPVGFNESSVVRVRPTCHCSCGGQPGCQDELEGPECNEASGDVGCRLDGTGAVCSGRGECVCGHCICEASSLGTVHGTHCELDDFSCPYRQGRVCGGRGDCVSAACRCHSGWTGDSCQCPSSTEPCLSPDGRLCSGRGRCVCGRCECDDPWSSGRFCEKCPTCDRSCQSHWKCVDCHLSKGLLEGNAEDCNRTCSPMVAYVHALPGLMSKAAKDCLFPSSESCHYRFQMDSVPGIPQIHISRYPECLASQRYYPTFICVFLLTVLLGLVILLMAKFLLMRRVLSVGDAPVYSNTAKESNFMPSSTEKTIIYRRDEPAEMPVEVQKIPLHEVWHSGSKA
ncbi:integrin beta-8 isoform X2 [Paramormyrops kingsleyae]|uniref:integrin beta-8 isoform X2 n=1 Tax=Paramormyrops kingsleyae TaxID=1676925 RepID=UPI003B96B591